LREDVCCEIEFCAISGKDCIAYVPSVQKVTDIVDVAELVGEKQYLKYEVLRSLVIVC
jgi:hypothetical protein